MERRHMTVSYEVFDALLKKGGIKSYTVSKDTGVSESALSRWKSGSTQPSLETLSTIARYFGVSVESFIVEDSHD